MDVYDVLMVTNSNVIYIYNIDDDDDDDDGDDGDDDDNNICESGQTMA